MERLDKELVNRKLAQNRTKAQELIEKGFVFINGKKVLKTSTNVKEEDIIEVKENNLFKYVSRGGFKLEKALNDFNICLKNKVVLDIGSSTGGFTDCALQNGAKKVIAVDVGTDLMHEKLRSDVRVELFENTNIALLSSEKFSEAEIIVTDVSFVSLNKIFESIVKVSKQFEIICLIKPQFECGKEIAKKYKGVILNEKIHRQVLENTILMFNSNNYFVKGLTFSPIKGGDGNIEYLAHLTTNEPNISHNINNLVEESFNNKF